MGDPTRLLSAHSEAEGLERELLETLRDAVPQASDRDAMWGSLATQLVALGVVSSAGVVASAVASSGSSASAGAGMKLAASSAMSGAKLAGSSSALVPKTLLAKLLLGVALAGAGAGGAALVLISSGATPAASHQERSPASVPRHDSPHAARGAAPDLESARPGSEPVPDSVDVIAPPPARPKALRRPALDALTRESRLLASARAALRGGDLSQTSRLLTRLSAEFPNGQLRQESDVLHIELLFARGKHGEAARQARRFMSAHPESPHNAKLERFVR